MKKTFILSGHDLVLMKQIAIDFQDYLTLLGDNPDEYDTVEKLIHMLREYEQILERLREIEGMVIETEGDEYVGV